jgi:NADPH2:quinone reductase
MKAAVVNEAGGEFLVTELPVPQPAPGQVLVRVRASGVNPLDTKIRAGQAAHAKHPLPAILGLDLAGTIEASDVEGFAPGQEVFGMSGGVGGHPGSLAQYAVADAALLARKPANLSMREAAALPLIFITAWEGLVDRADVQAGQSVLIQGGAGGVGHIVIQIARARGAKVFAVAREKDRAFVESLGATFIDRERESVADYVSRCTAGKGFDIVYDAVGGAALDASFNAVRRFGHVVSCLGWGTHALAPLSFRAATYSGVFTLLPLLTGEGRSHHGEILREAAKLAEAGLLKPRVDPREFGLDTAADAHREVEQGTARGRIVVDP